MDQVESTKILAGLSEESTSIRSRERMTTIRHCMMALICADNWQATKEDHCYVIERRG